MIRVALVDDHHAVRLGLAAMISSEPGMTPVGAATSAGETAPLLYRTNPDVVVVDYRLPDGDGLSLCQSIKGQPHPPAVVLHSAFADGTLTLAAVLAGADGVVSKGAPGRELAEAIRAVAAGQTAMPEVDEEIVRSGAEMLDADDLPILDLLVHGTPRAEVARRLRLDGAALRARLRRMLDALRSPSVTTR